MTSLRMVQLIGLVLRTGDLIISADGRAMLNLATWVDYVRARPAQVIDVEFERNGELMMTSVVPAKAVGEEGETIGQVGMSVVIPEWPEDMIREKHYGPVGALSQAVQQTWATSVLILDSVKKMLNGLISAKHLSGPITIAKVAGASAQYGLSAYLGFLALLSVSLGVLNLLPIPVLDGGHLAYYIIEAVKGSPVSEKIQLAGFKVGLFLVIGLMVLALYNDLMRL
ncbi:MAG: RIP metalloprotease RseP [Porticoccaceae bacterium]